MACQKLLPTDQSLPPGELHHAVCGGENALTLSRADAFFLRRQYQKATTASIVAKLIAAPRGLIRNRDIT